MKIHWSCGAVWSARRPVKAEVAGSNPVRTAKLKCFTAVCGRVAQLAERPPEKRKVPGSMPGPTTIFITFVSNYFKHFKKPYATKRNSIPTSITRRLT